MCLLAQIHPLLPKDSEELSSMYLHHGLVDRREQEEILEIFNKIQKETGWRIAALTKELKSKWRWADEVQPQMMAQQNSLAQFFPTTTQAPTTSLPPAPPQPRSIPSGILNPILSKADFSLPNHPYQSHYQPPNQHHHASHINFM
jgi:hypothetical protein